MATISSLSAPGVEVREYDNSLRITNNTGTTVFVPGYAAQGPVEEVMTITSIDDFENIYGIPTNDAERYFYYTCLAILNNSGAGTTLLTSRLAYGANDGDNVANAYTLLAYPVIPYKQTGDKKYDYFSPKEAEGNDPWYNHFAIYQKSEQTETPLTLLAKPTEDSSLEVVIGSSIISKDTEFEINCISGEWIPSFNCNNEDYINNEPQKPAIEWTYGNYSGSSELEIYSEVYTDNSVKVHISGKLINKDGNAAIGYIAGTLVYSGDSSVNVISIFDETAPFIDGKFGTYTEENNSEDTEELNTCDAEPLISLKYNKVYEKADALESEDHSLSYIIGAPAMFNVSLTEYYQILSGEYFNWSNTIGSFESSDDNLNTKFGEDMRDTLSKAAFITINTSRSIINESYEGLYFGITDNIFNNPSDLYDLKSINSVKFTTWNRELSDESTTVKGIVDTKEIAENKFISIAKSRLDFYLDSNNKGSASSIIQSNTTTFDTSSEEYDDTINFAIYKLAKSTTGSEALRLAYSIKEKYNASLSKSRVYSVANSITPQNYFVESIVESSKNLSIMVNPYISKHIKIDENGHLRGKVRFLSTKLLDTYRTYENLYLGSSVTSTTSNNPDLSKRVKLNTNNIQNWANICGRIGTSLSLLSDIATDDTKYSLFNLSDSLYQFGTYTVVQSNNKYIGSTPTKIARALELVSNDEEYPDLDLIVEGGLGTIYAYSNNKDILVSDGASKVISTERNTPLGGELNKNPNSFDASLILQGVEDLRTGRSIVTEDAQQVVEDYIAVQEAFQKLANSFQNGGRGDTFYVADILRGIVLRGANTKVEKLYGTKLTNNVYSDGEDVKHSWATSILNPIKHIVDNFTSSYASIYAQWLRVLDGFTNEKFWVPASGYMTALMCAADQQQGPWYAAAGLNRGIVEGVLDCAVNPNQKQRGDLYKICVNSVPKLANIGITCWGIRTLSKKASAFDQNTCRRTFLFIEKAIKKLLRYYLFEPNNSYTQLAIYNEIEPYMESIRNQGGIYSYSVVCSSQNNTPEIVNAGNLAVDVSAAPTRTAEFIVLNMTANKYTQEVSTSELNG